MVILLTGEYLDVTVAGVVEGSCPFTCVLWGLGVVGGVDAGGIVGDGHFGWDTCRTRGVVEGGGNMGFCEGLIWVVDAVVVSGIEWLSNSIPLTNGGVGCRPGGVIDIGSLETVADKFWVGSEEILPGNSSRKNLVI